MKLAYIISMTRSGSTVLSAMLDQYKGVVSPPESSFPQILGAITKEERSDPRMLAALYHGATFPPTQLSLADAEECMEGSDEEILVALGKAVAVKLGRDPAELKAVVWKSPKTIAMQEAPLATSGRFIMLRRNPHNVYESQFRITFGKKNRNPLRFALLRESYEQAFSRLPKDRYMEVNYDDLPQVLPSILEFIGAPDQGKWENHQSSLQLASDTLGYMSEVTSEFVNRDAEKRARLNKLQVGILECSMKLTRPLRPFLGPLRDYFDRDSLKVIRERALERLAAGK